MKLFMIAALIAVSSAARLEPLQQQQQLRKYLPPDQNSGCSSSYQGLGSNRAYGSFGTNSRSLAISRNGQSNYDALNAFPGVTNAYLPPYFESSASTVSPALAGSVNGFGAQNVAGQRYGSQAAFNPIEYQGTTQGNNLFSTQSRSQSRPSAVNRQYIAPHSSQNIPQQPFDEKTGYYY